MLAPDAAFGLTTGTTLTFFFSKHLKMFRYVCFLHNQSALMLPGDAWSP